MSDQKLDYTLKVELTSEMIAEIDRAIILFQDTLIRTRSEFIRAACHYTLDAVARANGDVPISVEERKSRVFGGDSRQRADHPLSDSLRI